MPTIELSPIALFLQAGLVGKTVMLLLLAASIWCWYLIAIGTYSLVKLKASLHASKQGTPLYPINLILAEGEMAARRSRRGETIGEKQSRLIDAMNRAARHIIRCSDRGLPALAIIASVTPFIGLLGTVWGIMASFAGIAEAKDTSLAVVAPGIAEALAATAYGLAAAIPASIGYNKLAAGFASVTGILGDFIEAHADEIMLDDSPNGLE